MAGSSKGGIPAGGMLVPEYAPTPAVTITGVWSARGRRDR